MPAAGVPGETNVSTLSLVLSAAAPRRRVATIVAAGAAFPFVVFDVIFLADKRIAAVGAVWTLGLLCGGLLQDRRRPWACAAGVLVAALATQAGTLAMILMTHGSLSPLFGLLVALPPCMSLFYPELPAMALGTAVVSIGGGVAIRLHDGRSALDVGHWAAVAGVVAGLALSSSALVRRHAERQLALERERRQALEALTRAERERHQLEQLAEAGRLAASVAHDVNGPLSAVRSNVACLLDDAGLSEQDRRTALRETQEAVQRIIDTVDRLRSVMWSAGRPAGLGEARTPTPVPAAERQIPAAPVLR